MVVVKNPQKKRKAAKKLESFEIAGVYLLNNEGVAISHVDIPTNSELDADVFNSMLNAIRLFIMDESRPYGELKDIEYGSYKILVEEGKDFYLVVMGKGDTIKPVRNSMRRIVGNINHKYGDIISTWRENFEVFPGIDSELNKLTRSFRFISK